MEDRVYCRRCGVAFEVDEDLEMQLTICPSCVAKENIDLERCPSCGTTFSRANGWKFCANRKCKIGVDVESLPVEKILNGEMK